MSIGERRDLSREDENKGIPTDKRQDLSNISNSIWLTIIGRTIDVGLIIWGIFIVSLMVVVLTNTLNMDLSEKRALTVLNRLDLKTVQKKHAANYIITVWKKQRLVK